MVRGPEAPVLASTIAMALIAALAGCDPAPRAYPATVRRELTRGEAAARAWPDSNTTSAVLGLGYLERVRLGLSSPFRTIDYALQDPRLDGASRARVAWALLASVSAGQAYEIEPIVLDRIGVPGLASSRSAGRVHVALLERAIASADDVEAAELGARVAYTLAESEGLIRAGSLRTVASVAALLVDRELAQRDAVRLLRSSRRAGSVLERIRAGRDQREFQVEQPRTMPVTPSAETNAARIAQELLQELRLMVAATATQPVGDSATPTGLTEAQLARLEAAGATLNLPPQTPIVLAARATLSNAVNEESLVLEYQRARAGAQGTAVAHVALQAAVAMRAYAQERVWYPGSPAPSARELQDLYGLASLRFDPAVPEAWRPYYRRMLASALTDLYRVMPATDLRGLHVRFGATQRTEEVLALHEPGRRRLILPLNTSAGTLAHELAHDVDWQQALIKYRVRGDYATDRAARRPNDPLSRRMRVLTAATLAALPAGSVSSAHARRPAEIFARNVDWYVSVVLASQGLRNGYLSSVQDEILTGYGTVRPPDASGIAGDALMSLLAELAPIYREQNDAFRALYGSARVPRIHDLARRVTLQTPVPNLAAGLAAIRVAQTEARRSVSSTTCGSALVTPELIQARTSIVDLAAQARARGAGLRFMQRRFGKAGRLAMLQEFYGGPVDGGAQATTVAAHQIASEIRGSFDADAVTAVSPFQLAASSCS